MNEISILNRANVFETGLFSWGIPEQTARELTQHHTELNYSPGRLIFSQGSPADIVMWIVKGVVREVCPNPNGTQTLVRLATAGDILGLADKLNDKGQWVRRFEAWTAGPCVLAVVTRHHVRNLLKAMNAGGTADAVGADEFGGGGMGSVLRDLPRPVISRAHRDGDGRAGAQIWYRRQRRNFAHVRADAFRSGGNDRQLAAGDRAGNDRADQKMERSGVAIANMFCCAAERSKLRSVEFLTVRMRHAPTASFQPANTSPHRTPSQRQHRWAPDSSADCAFLLLMLLAVRQLLRAFVTESKSAAPSC